MFKGKMFEINCFLNLFIFLLFICVNFDCFYVFLLFFVIFDLYDFIMYIKKNLIILICLL